MKLAAREYGEGSRRGLWLHGWLGSGREGNHLSDALDKGIRLVCPDLPGHGDTELKDWTLENTLGAIADLAENCDWAGGYSMGGRLLMMSAKTYPHRFHGLVVESASLGLLTSEERGARIRLDSERGMELRRQGLAAFCRQWYDLPLWGGFSRFPEREGDTEELAGALSLFSVAHQPDLRGWIQHRDQPVLWMAGKRDAAYAAQAEWVAACTSHNTVLLEAGHNCHLQVPGAWTASVNDFLSRLV